MTTAPRETAIQPIALPATLAPLVQGHRWSRNIVGESGDAVYRLQAPGDGPDLYLKHAHDLTIPDVTDEMARLRWLAAHIAVPAIRCFITTPDEAWLLMTALPGQTAYELLESRPDDQVAIVDSIAHFLRRLHAIPMESCPFNSDHRFRLGEARWRLDAGLVDVDDFDEEREGWSAEQVWDEMSALLPFAPDPVVTHGDISLDNILIADGGHVGCIDAGRAGIADRYQDLAIVWHGLAEFGRPLQERFFATYGIDQPDERKISFHLMLDEFF
ncbi:MAG: APH(3')-I family aminoglycoside O-phosphotransferase [Pseudomonadota bacterium]|jgi:aminoglycoside 3'-phosphotransferase-1